MPAEVWVEARRHQGAGSQLGQGDFWGAAMMLGGFDGAPWAGPDTPGLPCR